MGGRILRGIMPKHLKANKGKDGWAQSDASGFIRKAKDLVDDRRQGRVLKSEADITPGFGTYHPQDVKNLGNMDDPTPIPNASPISGISPTKQDLNISDQEIELSVRQGRQPREGF